MSTSARVLGSVLFAGALGLQAFVQPELAAAFEDVQVDDDSATLPAPEQTTVLSLGYRAALADTIYAHLLVSYGAHFQEKRRLTLAADYLDTVAALDPEFVEPYLYADTLITLQPVPPRSEDYDRARALLERATQRLPFEQRVWFAAGQFIGYLAPPRFDDPARKKEWKLAGARILGRACELATLDSAIPYHCLAAATSLNRAGQRAAMIEMLERTLAVNDDEEVRAQALAALQVWGGEQDGERVKLRDARFEQAWRSELGFTSKEQALLVGPGKSPERCTGRYAELGSEDAGCARNFEAWFVARDR